MKMGKPYVTIARIRDLYILREVFRVMWLDFRIKYRILSLAMALLRVSWVCLFRISLESRVMPRELI